MTWRICIADLYPEEGLFHSDSQGVFHFGFDRTVSGHPVTLAL